MPSIRSGLCACSLAAALGLVAAPAASADPSRPWVAPGLERLTMSAHMMIHSGTAMDPATAAALGTAGERTLAGFAALGFPMPADDGDGHVDVYVMALPASAGSMPALTRPDPAPQRGGAIAVRPEAVDSPSVIAHELFHLVQRAIAPDLPVWLQESTAEWAAFTVAGPAQRLGYFVAPGTPLDCADVCGGDPRGSRRWLFFEALAERFGPAAVLDVLAQPAARGLDAVQATLAARGTDLGGALADLAGRMAAGTFTQPGLAGKSAWVAAGIAA